VKSIQKKSTPEEDEIRGSKNGILSNRKHKLNDDELVLTPGGLRPKSKVHFVKPGQQINVEKGRLKIIDSGTGEITKDLDLGTESATAKKNVDKPKSGKKA
jgi:hypothetical protein